MPRFRRPPKRFGGDTQHEFCNPKEFFRIQYFEACDVLILELDDQKEIMQPVLCMESLLLMSANGEERITELKEFTASVFKENLSVAES